MSCKHTEREATSHVLPLYRSSPQIKLGPPGRKHKTKGIRSSGPTSHLQQAGGVCNTLTLSYLTVHPAGKIARTRLTRSKKLKKNSVLSGFTVQEPTDSRRDNASATKLSLPWTCMTSTPRACSLKLTLTQIDQVTAPTEKTLGNF